MARTPKADYVPLMTAAARRRLEVGDEVNLTAIADELGVSAALVHFYFGDRQSLVDAAWREILMAYVDDDLTDVSGMAEQADWDRLGDLVRRVFAPDRDAIHLAHVRGSAEAQRSEDLGRVLAEATATTVGHWRDLVVAGIEAGTAATDLDPEALGLMFMALPLGVAVAKHELTDHERAALAEAWTAMIRGVLDPSRASDAGAP